MDKKEKRKHAAGMQNIPLVYGDSMLGSENWLRRRPSLEDGWRSEHEARESPSAVVENMVFAESMDEVEHSLFTI